MSSLQHIFLLSHMRANTSLIGHILGSHAEINGYYEMHQSYCEQSDLEEQKRLYTQKNSIKNGSKYLFDKLLHNDYELLLKNLTPQNIKILVSIRPAEQSIKSIINLFNNKKVKHPYANAENATQYYIDRMKQLANFCSQYQGRYYYYNADIIRSNPKKLLKIMQKWLSLTSPLSEKYQIFPLTGKSGLGDSSANISSGGIVKQQTNYPNIALPPQLLLQAINKVQDYKSIIEDYAIESQK